MTIGEAYNKIRRALEETGEADAEAREILACVLHAPFSGLALRLAEECPDAGRVDAMVQKRLGGTPLAYVLNQKSFYGYDFYVDENVLIPRADSECVAECAIRLADARGYEAALDLCCGSGCLGIALLRESRSIRRVCFGDISAAALEVARRNAASIAPGDDCTFVQGDLFEKIDGMYDLIICNPPYISPAEYLELEPQVKDYEPKQALWASDDGYEFYERIAARCAEHVRPGGAVVLETGCDQTREVTCLLKAAGFGKLKCGYDLAGRPRFVSGEKK